MSYTVVTSFYNGNDFYEAGTEFNSSDAALLEKALADGNVVSSEGGSESVNPLSQPPVASDSPEPTSPSVNIPVAENPVPPAPSEPTPPAPQPELTAEQRKVQEAALAVGQSSQVNLN